MTTYHCNDKPFRTFEEALRYSMLHKVPLIKQFKDGKLNGSYSFDYDQVEELIVTEPTRFYEEKYNRYTKYGSVWNREKKLHHVKSTEIPKLIKLYRKIQEKPQMKLSF